MDDAALFTQAQRKLNPNAARKLTNDIEGKARERCRASRKRRNDINEKPSVAFVKRSCDPLVVGGNVRYDDIRVPPLWQPYIHERHDELVAQYGEMAKPGRDAWKRSEGSPDRIWYSRAAVYGLVSPEFAVDDISGIRYVGNAKNVFKRYREHIMLVGHSLVSWWMASLLFANRPPPKIRILSNESALDLGGEVLRGHSDKERCCIEFLSQRSEDPSWLLNLARNSHCERLGKAHFYSQAVCGPQSRA